MDNNELTHHGIRGMRWGVRRFQNKDGTLTNAGKKRYDKEMEKLKKEEAVLKNKQRTQAKIDKLDAKRKKLDEMKKSLSDKEQSKKDEAKKAKEAAKKTKEENEESKKKKTVDDLSNDELAAVVRRMELEKRFSDLQPEHKSSGRKFVDDVVKPSFFSAGKTLLTDFAIKKGKDFLGLSSDDPDAELKKKVNRKTLEKRLRDLEDAGF